MNNASAAAAAAATTSPATTNAVPASGDNATAAASSAGASKGNASASAVPCIDHKGAEAMVDDKRKRYRLMVKRRLLKRHGEELSSDSSTRKRQLEELYRDVEAGLLSLGAKLRKEQGRRGKKTAV